MDRKPVMMVWKAGHIRLQKKQPPFWVSILSNFWGVNSPFFFKGYDDWNEPRWVLFKNCHRELLITWLNISFGDQTWDAMTLENNHIGSIWMTIDVQLSLLTVTFPKFPSTSIPPKNQAFTVPTKKLKLFLPFFRFSTPSSVIRSVCIPNKIWSNCEVTSQHFLFSSWELHQVDSYWRKKRYALHRSCADVIYLNKNCIWLL